MAAHPTPDRASPTAAEPLSGQSMREVETKARSKPQPRITCPLCKGKGRLPAEAVRTSLTTVPERQCVMCDGAGKITDRQNERPRAPR